ncbi:hypothetical protein BH11PLA2_BH11PLA2_05580 [soil metagenome]
MSLFKLFARRAVAARVRPSARLRCETLEAREVPAVDLLNIANSDFPTNKPLFVPITVHTTDGDVTYTVSSSNSSVTAAVVNPGRVLKLTVSGTNADSTPFTGVIVIQLFEDTAPLATANIIKLANEGYYNGKLFHRVVNDFVIQGGSPNGDGQGGSSSVTDAPDEFNAQVTFASRGIVAMANAGDDNNNAQFFITDPFTLSNGTEVDAPLDRRSEFLNFNHTIVGIMTSGFDLYQTIMNVPKVAGSDGSISKPTNNVTITKAEVLTTTNDGVIRISAASGFLGSSNITVTAQQGSDTQDKTFSVTSVADTVNDRPFLGSLTNLTTTSAVAKTFTLPFTELDAGDTATFTAGRVVSTANGPVFTTLDPTQGTISVTQDGQVTITPAAGFTGTIDYVVGVRDQQDRIGSSLGLNDARNFDTEKLKLTVTSTAANTAPTISDIANQTKVTGTGAVGPVSFTIGDTETTAASLTVTVTSSNTTLLPNASVVLGGSGTSRTLTATPASGQTGVTTVTVIVTDAGGLTATDTFTLTVTSANGNTAPTISDIGNQSGIAGVFGPISFNVNDTQTPVGSLTVTATSSNTTLLPNASIVFGGSGAGRTLTATTASGQTGTTTVTVTVTDGDGATAVDTFTLTATAAPTVTLAASKTTSSTGRPVLFTATVTNGSGASVQFREGSTIFDTVKVVEGKAYLSKAFTDGASHTVIARVVPATGSGTVDSTGVTITNTTSAAPILITAEGSAFGTPNTVTIKNADGSTRHTLHPYGSFSGVVRVKVADVTGDGQLDVVAVPGFGGGPHIVVYDGNTGAMVYQNMIYGTSFRGGLSLDVGDARGLGYAQILVGAGLTGGPRVTLLDASKDSVLLNYFAYSDTNRGGVSVALSDIRGGNVPHIVTGAGQGLGPNINIYNPLTATSFQIPKEYGTFVAGSKTDTVGVRIGVGPLIESSRRDILVGDLDTKDLTLLSESFNPLDQGIFVG